MISKRITGFVVPAIIGLNFVLVTNSTAIDLPPDFGYQNPKNNYINHYDLVYGNDFEQGLNGAIPFTPDAKLTKIKSEIIEGTTSLNLSGPGGNIITFPASELNLVANNTYIFGFDYRILAPGVEKYPLGLAVSWDNIPPDQGLIGGIVDGISEAQGSNYYAIHIGGDNAEFTIQAFTSNVIVDNIKIYHHTADVYKASIPLIKHRFPRIANYILEDPLSIALVNNAAQKKLEDRLALFDLVNGVSIDHTLGPSGWVQILRLKNPEIIILPYLQSFMAENIDKELFGNSANLSAFFNRGLIDEWFLHTPSGEKMSEPLYPENYQLNHTVFAPKVSGWSVSDYMAYYLGHSVFPSGLWDGIHFDQSEWFVNPLLAEDRFSLPPAMDFNGDGQAETVKEAYEAWREAFENYFSKMHKAFGYNKLLFGNSGYVANNPTILSYLNGWQREFLSPYAISSNGDWDTNAAGGWYQMMRNYQAADRYTRAPQVNAMQYTGLGLGTATNTLTPNSWPNRLAVLEKRDFQRIRLGLTSTLLGNGYFGYDYVDNTTLPVWADEYSVNNNGIAAESLSGKGYLGQPINDAEELSYESTQVFIVDFESIPEAGLLFLGDFDISNDPVELVDGHFSLVVNNDEEGGTVFSLDPAIFPLELNSTYQFLVDYKLIEHTPSSYSTFFGITIDSMGSSFSDANKSASLLYPDIDRTGQTGTLRTSVKITDETFNTFINFQDNGKVSLDNIRLIKGTGGLWRRDFENGIVLVNPTPEMLFISQEELQGEHNRSGIKRILGTQAPEINNGRSVVNGIEIFPGDGIILLADNIAALPPQLSADFSVALESSATDSLSLTWSAGQGSVAGYIIEYGLSEQGMTEVAATGVITGITLKYLQSSANYYMRIAAYDFVGNVSSYSKVFVFSTQGAAVTNVPKIDISKTTADFTPGSIAYVIGSNVPKIDISKTTADFTPGSIAYVIGSNLSSTSNHVHSTPYPDQFGGTIVRVNGIKAPIISTSAEAIKFIVPWEIAGNTAVLEVENEGIASPSALVAIRKNKPYFWTWDKGDVIVFRAGSFDRVTADEPAQAGELILLLVTNLGDFIPRPKNGITPEPGSRPALPVSITLDNEAVEIVSTTTEVIAEWYGVYLVTIKVPEGITKGAHLATLKSQGQVGNSGLIYFE